MLIDKAEVVAILRARGLHARADWVDRELPPIIDTNTNGSLLRMLDVDLGAVAHADPGQQPGPDTTDPSDRTVVTGRGGRERGCDQVDVG